MILQVVICFFATISFAVLFAVPKEELIACGAGGAVTWFVYLALTNMGFTSVFSNMVACLVLTIYSRIFAAVHLKPATTYLFPGIFPLVPGALIYYTAYSLIINDMSGFSDNGVATIKTAGALVLGIIFGNALPWPWFTALERLVHKKHC